MVSYVKLPILKKVEYILWSMKTEQYLAHTDYALWEVFLNGNSAVQMTKDVASNEIKVSPISTFSLEQHIFDNEEQPGIDNLDIDDLYNNLKVYEADIKGSFGSSSNSQNVAFIFTESTSSTNELNTAYSIFTATSHISQAQGSSSYADELMFSFFSNQSSSPQLDKEDLEQIGQDDLEEMDLKWQVAMLSMRVKQFYKKARRKLEFNGKEPVGFNKNKVECFNCHRRGHFARDCRSARNSGNRSKDAGNIGYKGRDNGKRHAKEEDEQALETDSDDDNVFTPEPIPAKIDFVKAGESIKHVKPIESVKHVKPVTPVKTAEQTEKSKNFSSSPKVDKKLKWENNPKTEVRMAKQYVLPTNVGKGTGHRESRPVWNNVQRINHQNKFAPTEVFTRSGRIPVSAAKPKAAASTSATKPVNTVGPKQSVNFSRTRSTFHKSHSPIRRSFYNATTHSRRNSTERVNTAGSKAVSVVKRNRVTGVKTSAGHTQQALKNKGIVDSGCSRHMTGNKAYLADYQEIHDGGFINFGLSRGLAGCFSWLLRMKLVRDLDEFYGMKGIKREYSDARTPQQNRVTERKNMNLIEAARTMLADSLLPITFWAEAVNTACYVLNRALVIKTHNKTPYELLNGRSSRLDFMRPFGCPATILNTLDPLGKFMGKADEGFSVGYSVTSKAFRANESKKEAGDAADALRKEFEQGCMDQKEVTQAGSINSFNTVSNPVNAASTSGTFSAGGPSSPHPDAFIPANTLLHIDQDNSQIPDLEKTAKLQSTGIFNSAYDNDLEIYTSSVQSVGTEADFNNMESSIIVSPITTYKIKRKDQGLPQIESDAELAQRMYEEELAELDRAQKERQKQEEAIIAALIEEFDEIQARMDADHELAIRMTHEEQEIYTIKERARLLA
uniref:Ribonuclease H-like domain-containing protein n=1 Tax=Tanacetum cinerariifolium TaxID=118510 RepID=A0A6L2LKI1_TANCI|nr:ribonuclease H-like domain-containing protein [Tanacetum cinerariifolium]